MKSSPSAVSSSLGPEKEFRWKAGRNLPEAPFTAHLEPLVISQMGSSFENYVEVREKKERLMQVQVIYYR